MRAPATKMVDAFTDDSWQQKVLSSEKPVLVDFWAEWCAPCKMMEPTIDELAAELDERAKVGKIDVDANPKTVERYNILGMPTLILFKKGVVVERFVGVTSKENLTKLIERHLKHD